MATARPPIVAPRMMASKPKVMEAIEPHVCADAHGEVWTVRAGERLMSTHPAVLQNPQYFVTSSREDVSQPRLLPDEPKPLFPARAASSREALHEAPRHRPARWSIGCRYDTHPRG
jgi:hypothetical protein